MVKIGLNVIGGVRTAWVISGNDECVGRLIRKAKGYAHPAGTSDNITTKDGFVCTSLNPGMFSTWG